MPTGAFNPRGRAARGRAGADGPSRLGRFARRWRAALRPLRGRTLAALDPSAPSPERTPGSRSVVARRRPGPPTPRSVRGRQHPPDTLRATALGRAIAAIADKLNADLTARATHGYGGLKRALLGSVADKVPRSSSLPLLIQRPAD